MNKKKIIAIALIVAVVLVCIICNTFYTNSKYTTEITGTVTTGVAKWVFNLSGTDTYLSTDDINSLKLGETADPKKLVNGQIAPGTEGSFDIVVNAAEAEVGVEYYITFTNTSGNELPTNLILKLDGNAWNFDDGIHNIIDANAAATDKSVTHTISWKWPYNTTDGDVDDTTDGENNFDYSFDITAIGTQVNPN